MQANPSFSLLSSKRMPLAEKGQVDSSLLDLFLTNLFRNKATSGQIV